MLGVGDELSGLWILILGPAILAGIALVCLILALRGIQRRRADQRPRGGLVALAIALALLVFGIGSCYGAMWLG